MYYTIGEMAKKVGISAHTLRYYAKEGLFPFVERNQNGVRFFKEEDFEWLFIIECLKDTGMSIKDIKAFIDLCMQGDETIEQRLELFRNQKKNVEMQIAALQESLQVLQYKCWYYEKAKEAGSCSVHDAIKDPDIPEDIRIIKQKSKAIHKFC